MKLNIEVTTPRIPDNASFLKEEYLKDKMIQELIHYILENNLLELEEPVTVREVFASHRVTQIASIFLIPTHKAQESIKMIDDLMPYLSFIGEYRAVSILSQIKQLINN